MNVYSQLIKARFEQVASDLTENIKGLFWQNTTSNKVKYYDGGQVREVCDTDSAQSLSNKTLSSPVVNNPVVSGGTVDGASVTSSTISASSVNSSTISSSTIATSTINSATINAPLIDVITQVGQASTPAVPTSGNMKLYFKADGKAYTLDSAGKETRIGQGGGGSSLLWDKNTSLPPADVSQDGIKLDGFDSSESQEISLVLSVPSTYEVGAPIRLLNGAFCTLSTFGYVSFKTQTALIRPGQTVLGTYANTHSSTNAKVVASLVPDTITAIGEIGLTDAQGKINNIPVQPGDILKVKLFRDVANEGTSADGVAKLFINNFEVSFSN